MTTARITDLDNEDNVLLKQVRAGSTHALSQLYNRHRPLLQFIFFRCCGSMSLAHELIDDFFFKITVNLRMRPSHTTFRIWFYTMAIGYLFRSKISPIEKKIRSGRDQIFASQPMATPSRLGCTTTADGEFDCKTSIVISLSRQLRLPFVLTSLIGITPLIGARLSGISSKEFKGRNNIANQLIISRLKRRKDDRYLCAHCFNESTRSHTENKINVDQDTTSLEYLNLIPDWLTDPMIDESTVSIAWLRQCDLPTHSVDLSVIKILKATSGANRFFLN